MKKQLNVLLVYPHWPDTYWSFRQALWFQRKRAAYPPLGLLTVASMLPKHWNKRLVDSSVCPLTDADLKWADLAMFSAMLVHEAELLEMLHRCASEGVRTVVGGPIASSLDCLIDHADHVVIGEAENVLPQLISDIENDCGSQTYRASERPGLHEIPLPDLSLINPRHYSTMAVQYSRGCPFQCEFCDIIEIYGRIPRTKRADQVVAELDHLHEHGWRGPVFFVDDNFIGNKRNVRQMLPAIADWNRRHRMPFRFFTEATINMADDDNLLHLMREAGFTSVFIGIETPDERTLNVIQKQQNTKRDLLKSVRRIQSYGIEVMAGFIVGFDTDTDDIFDRQADFIRESAIPLAMIGLLQALPNTQLYRRLQKEGRLVQYGNGDSMSTALNFVPRMNPDRLIEGYRSLLQRIYNRDSYYERVREFLKHFEPARRGGLRLEDCVTLLRSMFKQGVISDGRMAYWKLFFEVLVKHPNAFGTAITLAMMGYHFQAMTERVCVDRATSLKTG